MDDANNQKQNNAGNVMAQIQSLLDDSRSSREEAAKKISGLEKEADAALRQAEAAYAKMEEAERQGREEIDELVLEDLAEEA